MNSSVTLTLSLFELKNISHCLEEEILYQEETEGSADPDLIQLAYTINTILKEEL